MSKTEKLEVVGVSLPPHVIKRLANVREQWGLTTNSAATRELFLLGLSLYESLTQAEAALPFLNLTKAYRNPAPCAALTPQDSSCNHLPSKSLTDAEAEMVLDADTAEPDGYQLLGFRVK